MRINILSSALAIVTCGGQTAEAYSREAVEHFVAGNPHAVVQGDIDSMVSDADERKAIEDADRVRLNPSEGKVSTPDVIAKAQASSRAARPRR